MSTMPTRDDARLILKMLQAGARDPDEWTADERKAVNRLYGYRDGRVEPADPADLNEDQKAQHRAIYDWWFKAHRALYHLHDGLQRIAFDYQGGLLSNQPVDVTRLRTLLTSAPYDPNPMDNASDSPAPDGSVWHLGEAYRSGLQAGRAENTLPEYVNVDISGLPWTEKQTPWPARRSEDWAGRPVYRVEGDPGAVAVGRFKASLRKFLGVERNNGA